MCMYVRHREKPNNSLGRSSRRATPKKPKVSSSAETKISGLCYLIVPVGVKALCDSSLGHRSDADLLPACAGRPPVLVASGLSRRKAWPGSSLLPQPLLQGVQAAGEPVVPF
jgi:hypothetical protein